MIRRSEPKAMPPWGGRAIPALGTATTAGALAGLAPLLLAEAGEHGRRVEALIGGPLVVGSSYVWVTQGAAMPIVLLLLLAAAWLATARPAWAGLLAGLAVWMRPDALAGLGLLGLLLWVERARATGTPQAKQSSATIATVGELAKATPWRYGLAAAVVVLGGILLARGYFGVWLPNTLAAKHALLEAAGAPAGPWGGPLRFWPRAAPLLAPHWGDAWRLLIAAGLLGQWPLFRAMGRGGRLLVLFAAFLD